MVVIVMGVSGTGKSTVGRALADRLGWTFVDADDLHSVENRRKMAAGTPLTDVDRQPWLELLRARMEKALEADEDLVLAFSGLKALYRARLTVDSARERWVYLHASASLIRERIQKRLGHFMPASLLDSQLETLEVPDDAFTVDVTPPPEGIVDRIVAGLALTPGA
ncbi:gluconokinase [Corallococcus sp. AB004]|uniref:gluconokinase n=1 Tax=Corallococcus exiguus TaxID=83462 RepID=UPI000EA12CD8|nr:gluconokinase [Corallococcus exiguus]NPD23704.1 gluconokinase [Corallococcus exiguus]NRD44657.1 gluconokinase [Corallococcus exiguus]RKI49467.1 gluconokinase [Corallococcus sp. AB004]